MRQAKQVCREMLIGLCLWMLLVFLVLVIFSHHKFAMAIGVIVGTVTSAGLILHMYRHLDIALDMDPKRAQTHTQISAFVRMLIMAAVCAYGFVCSKYVHPVGIILGLFGIKVSALAYPAVHKALEKRRIKSVS